MRQSKSPTTAPPASKQDKPPKRFASKYSPSGAVNDLRTLAHFFCASGLVPVWAPLFGLRLFQFCQFFRRNISSGGILAALQGTHVSNNRPPVRSPAHYRRTASSCFCR